MTSNLERRQADLDRFGYRYLENALTGHLLGQDYLLSSFSGSIARKGGIVEAHTDQWWMPWPILPERRSVAPGSMTRESPRSANMNPDTQGLTISSAVVCNIVWMLTDPGCVRVAVKGCSEKCRSEVNWRQLERARRLNL